MNIFVCVLQGCVGLLLLLSGIFLHLRRRKNLQKCTVKTDAMIIGHNYAQTVPLPVLEYRVNDKRYKVRPHYKYVSGIRSSFQGAPEVWVDETGAAHYKINAHFANFRPIARQMYPIGGNIQVSYNPECPRAVIVDGFSRPRSVAGLLLAIMGGLNLFTGVTMLFFI